MPVSISESVVLRSFPLNESDLVTTFYSRSFGRISGVAKGARRPLSRLGGRLEPLSISEIVFYGKEGRDLVTIDKAELIEGFSQKTRHYRCLLQLQLLAELLLETTPEREPNDPLYRLLILVLPYLTQPATADLAQVYFEIWYLKLAGLFPSHRHCFRCGLVLQGECALDQLQHFVCAQCKRERAWNVSANMHLLLEAICKRHLKDLSREWLDVTVLSELEELANELLQQSFERQFQTLKILGQPN